MKEPNNNKDLNIEKIIKKMMPEHNEEEIKKMKKDYGKCFYRLFDDSELDGIEESSEEIVLTEDEEKEFLDLIDNF